MRYLRKGKPRAIWGRKATEPHSKGAGRATEEEATARADASIRARIVFVCGTLRRPDPDASIMARPVLRGRNVLITESGTVVRRNRDD